MSARAARSALTLSLLALLAAAPALGQASDEFNWSGRVSRGQSLEIKNVNGPLFFEPASGDTIEVTAVKEGPSDDIAEVEIEVVEHADGVTICAIFPRRWGLGSNACEPGDNNHSGSSKNKTKVTFRVRLPAGVVLDATTMNGAISAGDLRSDVQLLTMNGRIDISTTGWASAKTMNGAIECRMGSTDWSGDIELESMNGAITVEMPANANAEIAAATMNGSVNSDWALEKSGWIRNKAHGTIGSGGRKLDISTMNGSIRIRKSS